MNSSARRHFGRQMETRKRDKSLVCIRSRSADDPPISLLAFQIAVHHPPSEPHFRNFGAFLCPLFFAFFSSSQEELSNEKSQSSAINGRGFKRVWSTGCDWNGPHREEKNRTSLLFDGWQGPSAEEIIWERGIKRNKPTRTTSDRLFHWEPRPDSLLSFFFLSLLWSFSPLFSSDFSLIERLSLAGLVSSLRLRLLPRLSI